MMTILFQPHIVKHGASEMIKWMTVPCKYSEIRNWLSGELCITKLYAQYLPSRKIATILWRHD